MYYSAFDEHVRLNNDGAYVVDVTYNFKGHTYVNSAVVQRFSGASKLLASFRKEFKESLKAPVDSTH